MATEEIKHRRAVMGTAYRDCDFCGRGRPTAEGKDRNWQYLNDDGTYGPGVYCSKPCNNSWNTLNAGK